MRDMRVAIDHPVYGVVFTYVTVNDEYLHIGIYSITWWRFSV